MNRTNLETWEDRQAKRRRALPKDSAFVTKLDEAKHALALVSELPEITELIDNAEAVRAAAKAKHISAEGINAWTRFVVDAERKGYARIEAMRAAGELAKQGGDRKSTRATCGLILEELINHRPTERISEWAALAKLTEQQLDTLESLANEEDRLVTRSELIKLGKAGSAPDPEKASAKAKAKELPAEIEKARAIAAAISAATQHQLQIDANAKIHKTERGAWVEALIWVEDELARSDLDD
jgi:hypothetical protein